MSEEGGRFGRSPHKPDELKEIYGTVDSGRLDVSCPGCGRDWYPTSKCCVNRYAGDPFCPDCGVDFRRSQSERLMSAISAKKQLSKILKTDARSQLHDEDFQGAADSLRNLRDELDALISEIESFENE